MVQLIDRLAWVYPHDDFAGEFAHPDIHLAGPEDNLRDQVTDTIEIIENFPVADDSKTEVLESALDWRVHEGLRQLRAMDQATFQHVIQVALLASYLGRRARLDSDHTGLLTKGALMHDLGKTGLDIRIVAPASTEGAKIDRNSEAGRRQFGAIKYHPEIGFLMAINLYREEAAGKHRRIVPQLILTHHCYNESRSHYPDEQAMARLEEEGVLSRRDLEDPELQWLGHFLALSDVYEAITANRTYAAGEGFEDTNRVLQVLLESHPTMRTQIVDLMVFHQQRFSSPNQTSGQVTAI